MRLIGASFVPSLSCTARQLPKAAPHVQRMKMSNKDSNFGLWPEAEVKPIEDHQWIHVSNIESFQFNLIDTFLGSFARHGLEGADLTLDGLQYYYSNGISREDRSKINI